jgi:hypothetical protein
MLFYLQFETRIENPLLGSGFIYKTTTVTSTAPLPHNYPRLQSLPGLQPPERRLHSFTVVFSLLKRRLQSPVKAHVAKIK